MRELPEGRGILLEEPEFFGPHTLCHAACQRFTALSEALLEERDSVHGQMAILAREVEAAVRVGAHSRAIEPFSFLEAVLNEARLYSEIEVAVATSFVLLAELRKSAVGVQVLRDAACEAPRVTSVLLEQERQEQS